MHRGYFFILTTWTILGLSSNEPQVPNRSIRSAPTIISRRNEAISGSSEFEENIDMLIEELQSLKQAGAREQEEIETGPQSDLGPSQTEKSSRARPSSRAATTTNPNIYINTLSSLYSIYGSVLVESFLQNLPQTVICVLADRTQCGWQADLTTTLSSKISEPMLSLLSALKSQTCPSTSSGSIRMTDPIVAQLNAFQELMMAVLSSSLPVYLSENFITSWNSFIDLMLPPVLSSFSDIMAKFLQTFVEFLTVGLQIGVDIPSLDRTQHCQQGDLKQLLMWGMNHNMSWSFGDSILDMFLALDTTSCSYKDTECQNTATIPLARSSESPVNNPTTQLTCDQQNVTNLNETLCADILANASQNPDALYGVCKALSTLSYSELIKVWRNSCQVVRLVLSPLLEPCPSQPLSQRVARSTLSLSKLFCNYDNWTTVEAIDPGLVTMCSDNDPVGFLQGVCNNFPVMQTLIANTNNAWVWEYCANASDRYMIKQYCVYDTWTPQTLDPSIVALCWNNDQMNMETILCQNLDILLVVFSNPENSWIIPNCSDVPTPSPVDINTLIAESCRYTEWRDIKAITIDQISLCIQNDEIQFINEVCANSSFLAGLLANGVNTWLGVYCSISISNPPTVPPVVFSIPVSSTAPLKSSLSVFNTASDTTTATVPLSISNTFYPTNTLIDMPGVSSTTLSTSTPSSFPTVQSTMSSGVPLSSPTPSVVTVSPTIASRPLTDMSGTSSVTLSSTTLSPSSLPTVLSTLSSIPLSPTTPSNSIISVSPTIISNTLQPTKTLTDMSGTSRKTSSLSTTTSSSLPTVFSTPLPPTTPLTFLTTSSTISVSATKVLTVFPVASSTPLFPSVSPTVSATNSKFSIPNTSLLPTVSRSTLSPTTSPAVPTASYSTTFSTFFFTSSMTLSTNISSTVPSNTLASIKPSTSSTAFSTILPAVSSSTLSPTVHPTVPPAIPSISNLCKYGSWGVLPLDPSIVGLCWQLDMAGFYLNVCCNTSLVDLLTLEPKNQWLKSVCSNNDTRDLLPQVCLYSEWSQPIIVDMTDLALCADIDTVNFTTNVCNNVTVLQNLLANLDNTWLLEQCANLTGSSSGGAGGGKGSLMGFVPAEECQYANWAVTLPDAALLALCWDYDQANFISSVCINPALLAHIIQEPSSLWVSTLCTTYSYYTQPTTQSNNTNSGSYNYTNTTSPCLVKDLVDGLNWSCSVDVSAACQAGITHLQELQLFFRCGVEVLLPRMQQTLNPHVAYMVRQATSVWVALLLVLEENGMTTLRVTDNIRQSVLDSVSFFLEKEVNFDKKQVLLQCFGKVLTSLMQTGRDVSSSGSFLIKEYFRIPLDKLRAVLSSVDVSTMTQILHYLSRNEANLQLTDEYLHTMVSVLIQVQLRQDETLFLDLSPLLRFATPDDISALPLLQNNVNVLNFINSIINSLSLEQRKAFGWWFSQSVSKANLTAGSLSFIRDNGNLSAYLPFHCFQNLSPAQLLDGLDVLMKNDLGPLKQQFIAQSIIGGYKNLTADQFRRLGILICQVNLNDLLVYENTNVFPVIQENIRTCLAQGIAVPSDMISRLFLTSSDLQSPTSLSSQKISQLAQFLPMLGFDFLQQLSKTQLMPVLSVIASVPFTPTQASVIIDKVSSSLQLSDAGAVSKLRFLASGLSMDSLWGLPSDALLTALFNLSQYTPQLTPAQVNIITTKLWGVQAVVTWLNEVEPLLSSTPLLCVKPRALLLLTNGSAPYTSMWNTQQAKTLFNEVMTTIQSLSTQQFMTLGTVAQGASCKVLMKLIQNNPSAASIRDVLRVLREQPVPLHTSLKKCVIDELSKFAFFSDLLRDMGAQIALSIPMSTVKKFSVSMMDTLRSMILQDPQYFLLMPSTKQIILVDKIVQRLGMYTGKYTGEEFLSLGVMATFVVDEVFVQLDRSFFVENLEFLRGFCYDSSKRDIVSSMLQEPSVFGPVQNWTTVILNQVDRFLFYLSTSSIKQIPLELMSQERIERLTGSQRQWESGDVGSLCVQEHSMLFTKQQFVLQYFLGLLKPERTASPVLTCESLHLTQPSAWPIGSLTDMSSTSFKACLELIGQDPSFNSFQLSLLLRKTKEVYGVVSTFSPYVTAELGTIATQLSTDELASLKLSDIRTISPLGAVKIWTKKQLAVVFPATLNSTKLKPSQLDSSFFVALGYIICGIDVAVIRSLNPVEFSKAVLWLGRLNLSCSEEQLQAFIALLSHNLAFGSISMWGAEVFIETGAFAAGIPDMAMSALVKEQIEGITPLAISLIPPKKLAVVFNPAQISWFSYDQAAAITASQRSALSVVQETALSMVLSPGEDKPVDFRGRSFGVAAQLCPLCHLCTLLVLLLMLLVSGPLH